MTTRSQVRQREVRAQPHHYGLLVEKLIDEGVFVQGDAVSVHVYHDHWCAVPQGGTCNCDPLIKAKGSDYLYSTFFDAQGEPILRPDSRPNGGQSGGYEEVEA